MSLTLTYEITGVKTQNQVNTDGETLSDAVVQTYWKCTGVDADGNEGTFSGATPFTAIGVPASEFVAFSDLTEATVLGWLDAVVTGSYLEHVKAQIQKQIDAQTVQEPSLPWASSEESSE